MALEDAIALFHTCITTDDVPAALQAFEQARRPGMEKVLDIAEQSYTWYETFHEKMNFDPLQLVYSYMTRSGRITDEALRQKARVLWRVIRPRKERRTMIEQNANC